MRDGGKGHEGDAAMSIGGGACVTSGGIKERDCCRLRGVIQEIWEDLPCSFPFFFGFFFDKVGPLIGLERKR